MYMYMYMYSIMVMLQAGDPCCLVLNDIITSTEDTLPPSVFSWDILDNIKVSSTQF